jgi:hypothetical protein
MASTSARQEAARQARRAQKAKAATDALLASFTQPNTTTWVDEDYASLLAKQLFNKVKSADSGDFIRLKKIRTNICYISEEPCRLKSGQPGTKVWALDYSKHRDGWMFISPFFFDAAGKPAMLNFSPPDPIYLSPHSVMRIYQRLRSNSATDFKCLVDKLAILGSPKDHSLGDEFEVTVPGGRFYVVRDDMDTRPQPGQTIIVHFQGEDGSMQHMSTTYEEAVAAGWTKFGSLPHWVVKTYIDDKK